MSIWLISHSTGSGILQVYDHDRKSFAFFEYFDDKIIYMKFSFRFWKGSIYLLVNLLGFCLHKYRKIWVRKDRACKYSLPFWVLSQVCFQAQVSSVIKCYRCHENRSRSIVLLQNRRRKRHKTSCISQQQNNIYIKWISWVTWTRFENASVFFFSENLISDPFSPHCAIMRFFRWLCDWMRQEVNYVKLHQCTISEALK